jgi:hypothetical protein
MAFGFGGIYDDDEAARIAEASTMKQIDPATGEISKSLPPCPDAKFSKSLPNWKRSVDEGGKVSDLLAMLQSKYTLTPEQLTAINAMDKPVDQDGIDEFINEMGA